MHQSNGVLVIRASENWRTDDGLAKYLDSEAVEKIRVESASL